MNNISYIKNYTFVKRV